MLVFMEADYRDLFATPTADRDEVVLPLSTFLEGFSKSVWFDTHDSSGMLRTYVVPLVDTYAKSQLMKNPDYYNEQHLTGVSFRDFVHEKFGVADAALYKGPIGAGTSKLRVGWNLMMMDWRAPTASGIRNRIRSYVPARTSPPLATGPPLRDRRVDISYRVGFHDNSPTVSWWRRKPLELFRDLAPRRPGGILSGGRLDADRYLSELRNSVIGPSPFGIGEIAFRDFEVMMSGAVLLKPRMEHLITYPTLFVENETYVAYEWDHSDLLDKAELILSNPAMFEDIAQEGRKRTLAALADGHGLAMQLESMLG